MLAIESPIPQFFNLDGTPLNAGKLYFGTVGTNPEMSPVAVYWDASGTIPASQPIATSNGFPVNGSTLATVYIATDYALTVRTAAGELVLYAPNSAEFSNATTVASAVASLSAELADAVTVGKGSSLVGVRDAGSYFTGSTVEVALQEIGATLTPSATAVATLAALTAGRTSPHANFAWFLSDFTVTGCQGPSRAYVLQDLRDAFVAKFAGFMTGSTTYVDGTNGSDANSGGITDPWATIDKAVRTSVSGTILVMPGTYASTGFRYTDTQGDRPKMLIAPYGGVKITTDGDVLASATWTANGTYGNVYETTLVTSNHVIRVLDSSSTDELGLPSPLLKAASLLALNTAGQGWWYDSATKKCYIRMGVLNVNSIKARFSAIYATGGDNQILVQAANLYVENITVDGYFTVLNQAGQTTPQLWLKNCTIRYAASNSRNVSGGYCYSQGCTYYRGTVDHANYNTANSVVARGVEIDDSTWYAGDVGTFGDGATQPNNPVSIDQNKNSSSNHDSYVVRVGGTHRKAYGPLIADTDGSYSWNLGVSCGYSYATGASKYGWIVQGSTARAWLDGCSAGPGNSGINSDTSAVTYTFNSFGTQVTSSSGSFSAYVPS